jgi:hypothetical protein
MAGHREIARGHLRLVTAGVDPDGPGPPAAESDAADATLRRLAAVIVEGMTSAAVGPPDEVDRARADLGTWARETLVAFTVGILDRRNRRLR